MRLTFRTKIFGLAWMLLVLMIASAMFSTRRMQRIGDEVNALADYLVPITTQLSDIQAHALGQEILLTRMLGTAVSDAGSVERWSEFEEHGRLVDRGIAYALNLANAGFQASASESDRLEFNTLMPALANIERQHQDYHDLALRMQALREAGQEPAQLTGLLGKERQELHAALDKTTLGLQSYSENSANSAAIEESLAGYVHLAATTIAVVLGLVIAALVTRNLVRPIRLLLAGTRAIEAGRLDTEIPVTTRDEIADLTRSFNVMLGELKVKEQIKDTFGKYVDPRIVEGLIDEARDGSVTMLGERERVSVFFSDVAGFTEIGEQLTPGGLVRLINRYLTLASEPIIRRSGIIDKYIGDAVMAFWAPPFVRREEQAALACLAALDQFEQLKRFRRELPELMGLRKGLPEIDVRIGIATGEAIVGNIGSEVSKSYTVMGDTVNLGSRLEGASKIYGTHILICEQTRKLAGAAIEAREIDLITVKGKNEPVRIFELLGRGDELSEAVGTACNAFEEGLAAYRGRNWGAAEAAFDACLVTTPDDWPAQLFLERVAEMRNTPPVEGWDGVWHLNSK